MSLQDIHLKNEVTRLNQQIDHVLAQKNQLEHKLTEVEIEKSNIDSINKCYKLIMKANNKIISTDLKIQSTYEWIRKQDAKIILWLLLILLLILLWNSIVLSYFLLP